MQVTQCISARDERAVVISCRNYLLMNSFIMQLVTVVDWFKLS